MEFKTKLIKQENDKIFQIGSGGRLPTVKNKNPENNIFMSTFHSFNNRTHSNFYKTGYHNMMTSMGSSKGFSGSGTENNFGETQKTFYTQGNSSFEEANLDDAKKLLGCYSVINSDFNILSEETKIDLFSKYNINIRNKQDHEILEKRGFKTIKQLHNKKDKLSPNDFREDNRPRGFVDGGVEEYYEGVYDSVNDLNINKQIYNVVQDIQNHKQYEAYMECHKKV